MLEAVHAFFLHQRAHLLAHLLAPPGDGDVEAVIARRFFGPAAPGVVGLHQALLGVGDDEINDGGVAPGQARSRAGEEVVHGGRAHEGQLHVRVRVNTAGHDVLAARVHHRCASGGAEVLANGCDLAVLGDHISTESAVCVDNGTATDEQGAHTKILLNRFGWLGAGNIVT